MGEQENKTIRSFRFDLGLCLLGQVVSLGMMILAGVLVNRTPGGPVWDNFHICMQVSVVAGIAIYQGLMISSAILIGRLADLYKSWLLNLYGMGLLVFPIAVFFILICKASHYAWLLPLLPVYSIVPQIWILFSCKNTRIEPPTPTRGTG